MKNISYQDYINNQLAIFVSFCKFAMNIDPNDKGQYVVDGVLVATETNNGDTLAFNDNMTTEERRWFCGFQKEANMWYNSEVDKKKNQRINKKDLLDALKAM